MIRITATVFSLIIVIGCREKSVQKDPVDDTPPVSSELPVKEIKEVSDDSLTPPWVDSLIIDYIKHADNELMKVVRRDSITMEWMYNRTENSDSAIYLVYQFGRSDEIKFTTERWLCVDSLKRKLYEYDIVADSLINWKRND